MTRRAQPTLPAQPHERGITYEEIAAAMGLDVATICSWLDPRPLDRPR